MVAGLVEWLALPLVLEAVTIQWLLLMMYMPATTNTTTTMRVLIMAMIMMLIVKPCTDTHSCVANTS